MISADDISFRPLDVDDLEMMHDWLNEPGVVEWWEGEDVSMPAVIADYSPDRPGAADDSTEHWIGLLDDEPIGWICCWPVLDGLEESEPWFPLGVSTSAAGIDYLLGAPGRRGQGLGSAMIHAFTRDIVFGLHPRFTQAAAGPYTANVASCRALEKAGFTFLGSVAHRDEPADPCSLMMAERADLTGES